MFDGTEQNFFGSSNRFEITDSSQVAHSRREISDNARQIGFDQTTLGKIAIIVTEMATNILKHAKEGEIVTRHMKKNGQGGLEILAIDKGPGIKDVDASLRDGYSTAGSAGTGLGAIARQSHEFSIYSTPGFGTVLLSHIWPNGQIPDERIDIGGVSVAVKGETECGDGYIWHETEDFFRLFVVDGLGHGLGANEAARQALRIFSENAAREPRLLTELIHSALKSTRGAAGAITSIDLRRRTVQYAGVGNICATVLGAEKPHRMVSLGGTLGHGQLHVKEFSYPWPENGLLIMHSDGIDTRWSLDSYNGYSAQRSGLLAALLYRDHRREKDDATVVVAKAGSGRAA